MQKALSDQEIMDRLLDPKGNRQAFEYLYRQVYPAVRKQVKSFRGNEDDARDVFQEGVLALWKNAREGRYTLHQHTKLSTYLIEICKRRWMDQQKKASTRYEYFPETLPETGQGDDVLSHWIEREEQAAFQARFGQLGARCQEILRRFYYEKQSMKEIAEAFQLGEASAKNEKYRCMQRLKKLFPEANTQP
ncbi:MAG: sigma-70 family RNA polymerase sigma factor [Bacteroidetes bacterium]|nr:MAG: sigma-70 family RNA polymerase sigma factor [Bacteroidota bacterium]